MEHLGNIAIQNWPFLFCWPGQKRKEDGDCDATWVHLQIYGMLLGMLWTLKSPASSESKLQTVKKKNGFLDVLLGKIQRENWGRHGRAIMCCHVFAYQHVHCTYIVLMCLRCMFCSEDTVQTRLHYVGAIVYCFFKPIVICQVSCASLSRFRIWWHPKTYRESIPKVHGSLVVTYNQSSDTKQIKNLPKNLGSLEMDRNTPLRAPKNEDREHFGHTSHMCSVSLFWLFKTRWWQLKCFLFSPPPLFMEMIQFDEHIIFKWVGSTTTRKSLSHKGTTTLGKPTWPWIQQPFEDVSPIEKW